MIPRPMLVRAGRIAPSATVLDAVGAQHGDSSGRRGIRQRIQAPPHAADTAAEQHEKLILLTECNAAYAPPTGGDNLMQQSRIGSAFNDLLRGSTLGEILDGRGGSDTLEGPRRQRLALRWRRHRQPRRWPGDRPACRRRRKRHARWRGGADLFEGGSLRRLQLRRGDVGRGGRPSDRRHARGCAGRHLRLDRGHVGQRGDDTCVATRRTTCSAIPRETTATKAVREPTPTSPAPPSHSTRSAPR